MVRIVRAEAHPEFIGSVCTITTQRRWLELDGTSDFVYGTDITFFGRKMNGLEDNFAPIYDGDQPASWEDCAWSPEKEKA